MKDPFGEERPAWWRRVRGYLGRKEEHVPAWLARTVALLSGVLLWTAPHHHKLLAIGASAFIAFVPSAIVEAKGRARLRRDAERLIPRELAASETKRLGRVRRAVRKSMRSRLSSPTPSRRSDPGTGARIPPAHMR